MSAAIAKRILGNEKTVQHPIEASYAIEDDQFIRTIGALLGPALIGGNRTTELLNGDAIFPEMLAAIRGAQRTLTFETFIYWSGRIGKEFAEAFSERARAGVRVLILLDWVGSLKMERELLEQMQQAGCEVVRFHAPRWRTLSRLNNRTHRKVLVADGKVGFTGGVGIGDEWTGHAQDPKHWRDSHFKVEGPVVAQMQAVFMVNWIKVRSKVEHTGDFFPALETAGHQRAQMFHSSPDEGSESIRLMYMLSIAAARNRLLLEQAYFVPDDLVIGMLADAARRGVRVEVILPGEHTDTPLVRLVSRSRWKPLLEAGVRIFEYLPTHLHAKIMVVDGLWCSVGSTNFDNRAFRLNDEANLNVYDAALAAQLERSFEDDRRVSREITLETWKSERTWSEKVQGWFWGLFRYQM